MRDSAIAWTDHTFSPWWGCHKIAPECSRCYAATFAKRTGHDVWGADSDRRFFGDKHWNEPRKWNAEAQRAGERHRVFCSSMADVFEARDDLDEHRKRLWGLVQETPNLDWLLLTKRPENIARMLTNGYRNGPWSNVWLGTSVGHRDSLWRADVLRAAPAVVRFLSCEPLLEDLGDIDLTGIHWLIVGGESGPGHREMPLASAEALVRRAQAAGVKVFVKQDSGPYPGRQGRIPAEWFVQDFPR